MLRLLLFSVLALTLLFTSVSCTKKTVMASGQKHSAYTKFNFRLNNNQITRASIYKRYVAHNRNFRQLPASKKNSKPGQPSGKRYLAQNR